MPRTRSSLSLSAGRLARNTLYKRPPPQSCEGESAAYKESMLRDKDEPNMKPSFTYPDLHTDSVQVAASQTGEDCDTCGHDQNEDGGFNDKQAIARPDQGQEDDDLSPADQAQIEKSARFEGPNGELLNRNGRQLLGPEGTILINTNSSPLASWETCTIEAGNRNFHGRSLNRRVNGEQGKHRKVPLAHERTEPVGEQRSRRMLGPQGTILIHEKSTFSQDDGRYPRRANGAPQFRRVGFGPEGTQLIVETWVDDLQ